MKDVFNSWGKKALMLLTALALVKGGAWGYEGYKEGQEKEKAEAAQQEQVKKGQEEARRQGILRRQQAAQRQKEEAQRQKAAAEKELQRKMLVVADLFQACVTRVDHVKDINPAWAVEHCDLVAKDLVLNRSAGEQKGFIKCLDQAARAGYSADVVDGVVSECQGKAVYYAPKK